MTGGTSLNSLWSIDHGSQTLRLEHVVDVEEIAVWLQSDGVKTLVAAPRNERGEDQCSISSAAPLESYVDCASTVNPPLMPAS